MDLGISSAFSRRNSTQLSRKTSWGTSIPPPGHKSPIASKEDIFDSVDLSVSTPERSDSGEWNTLDNITALGLSFTADDVPDSKKIERFSLEGVDPVANRSLPPELEKPFNKWMRNLQWRGTQRRKTVSCDIGSSALERELFDSPATQRLSYHKKSSSGSSFGFVTAVKSASISLASFSVAPRSRRTGVSSRHQRTDRSSKASNVGRLSEDSTYTARGLVIDQAVLNRLLQRRRVLEELVSTEEAYIADVKFLMNVSQDPWPVEYFTHHRPGLCNSFSFPSESVIELESLNQPESERNCGATRGSSRRSSSSHTSF